MLSSVFAIIIIAYKISLQICLYQYVQCIHFTLYVVPLVTFLHCIFPQIGCIKLIITVHVIFPVCVSGGSVSLAQYLTN